MIYFKNMTVNATTDEKNKNRVSSAEKNSDNILNLWWLIRDNYED